MPSAPHHGHTRLSAQEFFLPVKRGRMLRCRPCGTPVSSHQRVDRSRCPYTLGPMETLPTAIRASAACDAAQRCHWAEGEMVRGHCRRIYCSRQARSFRPNDRRRTFAFGTRRATGQLFNLGGIQRGGSYRCEPQDAGISQPAPKLRACRCRYRN
jgi:hypothetical protein